MSKLGDFVRGRESDRGEVIYFRDEEDRHDDEMKMLKKLTDMGEQFPEIIHAINNLDHKVQHIERNIYANQYQPREEVKPIQEEPKVIRPISQLSQISQIKEPTPSHSKKVYSKDPDDTPEQYWGNIADSVLGSVDDESVYNSESLRNKLENVTIFILIKTIRDALRNRDIDNSILLNNNLLDKFGQYNIHRMKQIAELQENNRQLQEALAEREQIITNLKNDIDTLKEGEEIVNKENIELRAKYETYTNVIEGFGLRTMIEKFLNATDKEIQKPLVREAVKKVMDNPKETMRNTEERDKALKELNISAERYDRCLTKIAGLTLAYLKVAALHNPDVLKTNKKAKEKVEKITFGRAMNLPLRLRKYILQDIFDDTYLGKYIGEGENKEPLLTKEEQEESVPVESVPVEETISEEATPEENDPMGRPTE